MARDGRIRSGVTSPTKIDPRHLIGGQLLQRPPTPAGMPAKPPNRRFQIVIQGVTDGFTVAITQAFLSPGLLPLEANGIMSMIKLGQLANLNPEQAAQLNAQIEAQEDQQTGETEETELSNDQNRADSDPRTDPGSAGASITSPIDAVELEEQVSAEEVVASG